MKASDLCFAYTIEKGLRYLDQLKMSFLSLNLYHSKAHVFIIHKDLTKDDEIWFKNLVKAQNKGNKVFFVHFDENSKLKKDKLEKLANKNRTSKKESYLMRFFIPEIFSFTPEIERVVYLDCDTIVNHNLQKLFDEKYDETAFIGAKPELGNHRLLRRHRMAVRDNYFNTGVLVFNLAGMRTWGFDIIHQSLTSLFKKFIDQEDSFNWAYGGNTLHVLDWRFNVHPIANVDYRDIKILHTHENDYRVRHGYLKTNEVYRNIFKLTHGFNFDRKLEAQKLNLKEKLAVKKMKHVKLERLPNAY